jgi:hypothetical protein
MTDADNIVWSHGRCAVSIIRILSCSYANNRRILLFFFMNDEHRNLELFIKFLVLPRTFIEEVILLAAMIIKLTLIT